MNPLNAVIGVEILGVILMMLGLLPREAALFVLGIFAFFTIFAPLKQAVLFAVFSIPLYTALPITDSFDSMASWRIIIAILFLRAISDANIRMISMNSYISIAKKLLKDRMGVLVGLFFALGALSLLVAEEPIFGIRKLLYLANVIALFFVIREVAKSKQDFADILKYTFAGSLLALAVGYAQFITILFVPLYTFWQWWASHVIPVFYGANLGHLLSYSNTWFSYYEEAEATLRMFSFFPDSHSFALSMILALPMAMTFFVMKWRRAIVGSATVLILLAIIFSGTRGAWIGAIPVFLVLVFTFFRGPRRKVVKIAIISLLIFAFLFPVSSYILKFSQSRQGGIVSETAFERISTSFNTRELSNMGRIEIWKSTFKSIQRHPFLGVGMGNYPVVLDENVSAAKEGASAHSLYLDVASETGLFGGLLLILIFLEILWRAMQVFLKNQDPLLSTFAGFFAVYFLWVMAYSAVDVVLLNDKVLLLFVTLTALLYARNYQYRGEK